jgi:hypothetical protein
VLEGVEIFVVTHGVEYAPGAKNQTTYKCRAART